MDGYPRDYVAHNIPLIVLSGLTSRVEPEINDKFQQLASRGIHITSDVPEIETDDASKLLEAFTGYDGDAAPWNGKGLNGRSPVKIKAVGRDFYLPPRRSELSEDLVPPSPSIAAPILHSELSPLSPGSKLFPDGLMHPAWIEKHQQLVPSIFILFYSLTSSNQRATLQDNEVKTDISRIQSLFSRNGFKSRVIAVLLGDGITSVTAEVEERLNNIRKATGLDAKSTLFFLHSGAAPEVISRFAGMVLTAIVPLWLDYYRDLTKHARRKRGRSTIPLPTAPPTSGTSQTLGSQGWNARYDFKLGVFAEFRQEMDVAVRSYETSYMTLMGDNVFETIANWSPRWDEARMLADVLAIRIIRCLLWNGHPTPASRFWRTHKERICDMVDRRGKGSSTYGWEAWEARWCIIMAELIKKAEFPDFTKQNITFLSNDKALLTGERTYPWESLHHPGYWYRQASVHQQRRRALAYEMPEEDRRPPGQSPASQIASKAFTYDTYLAPEPHEEFPLPGLPITINHSEMIQETLETAITEFSKRNQLRFVTELTLQSASESLKREDWGSALRQLRRIWHNLSFRGEGWLDLVEETGWMLLNAAANSGDGGTLVSVSWELLHRDFTYRPSWHYDLLQCLDGVAEIQTKPVVILRESDIFSFVTSAFAFEKPEGKVGEVCKAQLSVTSNAQPSSAPVAMTEVKINFDGELRPVLIRHSPSAVAEKSFKGTIFQEVVLHDESNDSAEESAKFLLGEADLTLVAGQTKVFEISTPLRDAGRAKAVSSTLSLVTEGFEVEHASQLERGTPELWWRSRTSAKRFTRPNPGHLTILPKPPKMRALFVNTKENYYCNEVVQLQIEVSNGEVEDADALLEAQLLGDQVPRFLLEHDGVKQEKTSSSMLPHLNLGKIGAAASTIVTVWIDPAEMPSVYELTVKISYSLISDPETHISCSSSTQLSISNAFEANYEFAPRVHPDPFPSFFAHEETDFKDADAGPEGNAASPGTDTPDYITPAGVSQKWCLSARYCSFAAEPLLVEDLEIKGLKYIGGIKCLVEKAHTELSREAKPLPLEIQPKNLEQTDFTVTVQKLSLDDRRSGSLDLSLGIKWRRLGHNSPINTTVLPIPRLLVCSSEPRVLASVSYSTRMPPLIHLEYTIENPSMHFLTFGLTMELSDSFAFSGSKQSTVQILPLSRHTVRFRVLPSVEGEWIEPVFVVRDRYFQKLLRVLPTDGMKSGKDGVLIWVPTPDEVAEGETEEEA